MKKIIVTIYLSLLVVAAMAQNSLTKEEKSKALDYMKETQKEVMDAVKGLSSEQLNYKPSEEAWSIAETMEHIAISENKIFGIVHMTLEEDPDPSKRSEVAMSDDQIMQIIESREKKVKTRPEFEPNTQFGGFDGSVAEFSKRRKENMQFVKMTEEDLRNRYFDLPFGTVDAYQVILFMASHSKRHADQIKEIKSSEGFPKS